MLFQSRKLDVQVAEIRQRSPEMCKTGQSEKNEISKKPLLKVDKMKKSTTRKRNESSLKKGERSVSLQEEVDPYSISNDEDDVKEKENMKVLKNKKRKKTSNLTELFHKMVAKRTKILLPIH